MRRALSLLAIVVLAGIGFLAGWAASGDRHWVEWEVPFDVRVEPLGMIDDATLAVATPTQHRPRLLLRDLATGASKGELAFPPDRVGTIVHNAASGTVLPDGAGVLLTTTRHTKDQQFQQLLWCDGKTGALLRKFEVETNRGLSKLRKVGPVVAAVAAGEAVLLWNAETGAQLAELKAPSGVVMDYAISPDGGLVAVADRRGGLFLLAADGELLHTAKGVFSFLAWAADGTEFSAVALDSKLRQLVRFRSNAVSWVEVGRRELGESVALHPASQHLVTVRSSQPSRVELFLMEKCGQTVADLVRKWQSEAVGVCVRDALSGEEHFAVAAPEDEFWGRQVVMPTIDKIVFAPQSGPHRLVCWRLEAGPPWAAPAGAGLGLLAGVGVACLLRRRRPRLPEATDAIASGSHAGLGASTVVMDSQK